jgi:hypothetical protein
MKSFRAATRSPKYNFDFLFLWIYLLKTNMCIFLWKYFARQIYSCSFHISKLNDLRVIHDLYSQCFTQIMSKTTSFTKWYIFPMFDSNHVQNDFIYQTGGSIYLYGLLVKLDVSSYIRRTKIFFPPPLRCCDCAPAGTLSAVVSILLCCSCLLWPCWGSWSSEASPSSGHADDFRSAYGFGLAEKPSRYGC